MSGQALPMATGTAYFGTARDRYTRIASLTNWRTGRYLTAYRSTIYVGTSAVSIQII